MIIPSKKTPIHPSKESIKDVLKRTIKENNLRFKYFISVNYASNTRITDSERVISDNSNLRFQLRRYFKRPIKCWFFVEKHRKNPNWYCHGGFHRHILIEDPFGDDSHVTAKGTGEVSKIKEQIAKDHLIMRNRSIPDNEDDAVKIEEIYFLDGLLEYLSKETCLHDMYLAEVIDYANSDFISKELLDSLYEKPRNNIRKTRYQDVFARTD